MRTTLITLAVGPRLHRTWAILLCKMLTRLATNVTIEGAGHDRTEEIPIGYAQCTSLLFRRPHDGGPLGSTRACFQVAVVEVEVES